MLAWLRSAWLLLSFSPFPVAVGYPVTKQADESFLRIFPSMFLNGMILRRFKSANAMFWRIFSGCFQPIQWCLVTFQRMNSKGCYERELESNITLDPKKKLMGSARIAHSHTAPFSRWHSGFIIINICFWWTQKQPRKAKKMHATRMQRIVVKLANPAIKISNHKTTELQKCNLKLQIHMQKDLLS